MDVHIKGETFILQRYIHKTKRWRLRSRDSGKLLKRRLSPKKYWTITVQGGRGGGSETLFRSSGPDVSKSSWHDIDTDSEIHIKAEEIRLWVHRTSVTNTKLNAPTIILGNEITTNLFQIGEVRQF